jgi:hypothetical protein
MSSRIRQVETDLALLRAAGERARSALARVVPCGPEMRPDALQHSAAGAARAALVVATAALALGLLLA